STLAFHAYTSVLHAALPMSRRHGLVHLDAQTGILQGYRQRVAYHAAACDEDVGFRLLHSQPAISFSISPGSFTHSAVSTSGAPLVTATSSSMRMPVFHHFASTPFMPAAM